MSGLSCSVGEFRVVVDQTLPAIIAPGPNTCEAQLENTRIGFVDHPVSTHYHGHVVVAPHKQVVRSHDDKRLRRPGYPIQVLGFASHHGGVVGVEPLVCEEGFERASTLMGERCKPILVVGGQDTDEIVSQSGLLSTDPMICVSPTRSCNVCVSQED